MPIADVDVRRADTFRARLLGLALRREPPPWALHLPRTRAVHTFGMRFPLDLHWLAADGAVIRVDRDVPPRALRACRGARGGVVEVPARGSPSRGGGTSARPPGAHPLPDV